MAEGSSLGAVAGFVDAMQQSATEFVLLRIGGEESTSLLRLNVDDLGLLLSVAQSKERKEFLEAAERAVKGWKRANTRQLEVISRLQDDLALRNSRIRDLMEEQGHWEEWSNDLAELVPEDAEGINPEGAQEGIILDYLKHLKDRNAALQKGVDEVVKLLEEWYWRGAVRGTDADVVTHYKGKIREALEGLATREE